VRRRYETALSLGRQQIADETAEEVPTGASRTFRTVERIFVSSLFRGDMAAIRLSENLKAPAVGVVRLVGLALGRRRADSLFACRPLWSDRLLPCRPPPPRIAGVT
jgi:hypothetical protein